MKLLNLIWVFLFVISAALQYNDPDPYLWIPIYGYGAVLCYLAFRGRYPKPLYLIGLTVFGAYALYLLFTESGVISWAREHEAENIAQSMKATKPWIESTREFFGLIILMVALGINMIWFERRKRAPRRL